ncbi:MAG: YbjN domain-containing protein [Acidobacteriota bacterium]|nr:YbjN domain-containing protein [Acidobacteriota bacterium]
MRLEGAGASSVPTGVPDAERRQGCRALVDAWAAARLAEGGSLVAVDRDPEGDRWYLRLAGTEKEFVTVWLTMRQRTLHHEAQLMPAPETNVEATYEYLLRRNAGLKGARFALGPEDAVYLVGEVPLVALDEDQLDRILGSSLAYVDDVFPTAMTIGFAGRYRRRRR